MKVLAAAVLVVLTLGDKSPLDMSTARRIVVLHQGRAKPLDSFAREMLRTLTGKERFTGYRDPVTNQEIVVFGSSEPVEALLRLVAEPQRFRGMNFIRVDHPDLKKRFKLDEHRLYFSLRDFDACREELRQEEARIDRDEATSAERAMLTLVDQQAFVEAIFAERILSIVPVPFGETGFWMTPGDLQIYFSGVHPTDFRFKLVKEGIEKFLAGEARADRENLLRAVVADYDRMKSAVARNDAADFASATEALEKALRTLNPGEVPSPDDIDRELWYNQLKPFSWAAGLFAIGLLLFLGAYIFRTNGLWIAALGAQSAAIGMTAYGYGLRWIISGRYPLSNHYESMIMVAFAAAIISLVAELILRRRIFGLAGTTASCLMILLAESVPVFAEQSAIRTITPALQTFWMTIHVPVIMSGYAGGLVLCVVGHIYVFMHLFRRLPPERAADLDDVMYRILQVTVLFLLAGILLGAVWAGEAWGRPWGWDMKETWALITLVAYIATLHGRFTGKVRGLWTALCGITAFMLVILCYYGVNFLFGRGLHTYGFGSGDVWPVIAFFGFEAALMITAAVVEIGRRNESTGEPTPV